MGYNPLEWENYFEEWYLFIGVACRSWAELYSSQIEISSDNHK